MIDAVDYVALGSRLRSSRQELNLTQQQLAGCVGVSASFVGHVERAEKIPSLDTVASICAALGISMDYLVFGKKNAGCDCGKCGLYVDIKSVILSYEPYINIKS